MIRAKANIQNATRALWSRDFVLNLIVAHCVFVAYTAMSPIIPLYAEHRGLTDLRLPIGVGDLAVVVSQEFQLGIIVGSFGLIGLIVRPYTGRWVYTFGAKRIAVIGPIALGAATMLHIFAVRAVDDYSGAGGSRHRTGAGAGYDFDDCGESGAGQSPRRGA